MPATRAPQLILALDVPSVSAIAPLVAAMPPRLSCFKVGLELFCGDGPAAVQPVLSRGKELFLDLKLHDIPRTVGRATRRAAGLGARLLTVHASGGGEMVRAAVDAASDSESETRILAVTLLTSMGPSDLQAQGIDRDPPAQVLRLAEIAVGAGAHGLVCSALEARTLRGHFGPDLLLVTPGIRAGGDAAGDQKRIATAAEAVSAGADFLVVGRPILDAPSPREAAESILREMDAALARRSGSGTP